MRITIEMQIESSREIPLDVVFNIFTMNYITVFVIR